jgi:hypothetical protein
MGHLHKIFYTPILQTKFRQHKDFVFKNIPKIDKKPDTWTTSVNTTFPNISNDDILIPNDKLILLKKNLLTSIVDLLNDFDLPCNIDFLNFWYNCYYNQQGQEAHWHMPSVNNTMPYWSGIYYNKNTTTTLFHREHGAHRTHSFDGYENSKIKESNYIWYSPDVEDGDIILFPPHLVHSIKYSHYDDNIMRLTFSFNLVLS